MKILIEYAKNEKISYYFSGCSFGKLEGMEIAALQFF
jgi:hypothetical protein